MNKTEELVSLLTSLKTAKFHPYSEYLKTIFLAGKVLESFFQAEATKTELSVSERKKIAPLIADSLYIIGAWLSYTSGEIDDAHIESYKSKRSGLEFIFERYKELQDGKGNSLSDALETFKATEDIESWDEEFKLASRVYDPEIPYRTSRKFEEIEKVPATHWWWSC